MKAENLPLAIVAATAIGIVQTAMLVYSWVYIAIYNPVPHWLTALGMHGALHRTALFCTDFMFSVVLCLPAAFLLSQLRPRKLLVYLACAVVPGFLWQYSLLFEHPTAFRGFGQFIPGILYSLLMLPAAVFVVTRFRYSAHA
jgi:hypothetical protein